MSYPVFGNLSLGNVSGNIKLFVNHSGIGNLTGIGYNNNAITFGVNQSATDTPDMTINRIGDVNILGNVLTGGNLVVNSIVPSTSTTTGALRIAGGAGIQGNLNIGGLTYHVYDTSFNGNAQILSRTASTSTTTGALVVAGGVGIQGNLNIGLDSFFNGNIQLTQLNNPLTIVSRNASLINTSLSTNGNDVGIFYGATNPAAAGLVISPRGTGGGIKMSSSGSVGINATTPRFTLDVAGIIGTHNAVDNKKLVLWDPSPGDNPTSATNFYGFGINSGTLRYQADTNIAIHAFYGGSTEYMRISSGKVGIGTTNPTKKLSLGNDTSSQKLALYEDSGNNFYGFGVTSSAIHFGAGTNYNANGQMVLTSNGYVGIGTTNPQFPLDISGQTGTLLRLSNNVPAYQNGESNIEFWSNVSWNNPLARIVTRDIGISPGAYQSIMAFQVNYNSTSASTLREGMRLVGYGETDVRLGIGTSNPQMILDVSGGIGTKIHNLFTNSQNGVMTLGSYRVYTSGLFDVGFALYHDQVGATVLNAASGQQIDFKINNVLRMRLNQDGNFGIGTTNPQAKLDVNGNINITASNTSYISGPLVSTNTTSSTSTTTGALVVSGGAGIGGNVFLGGNLTTSRDIECNGNIQIANVANFLSDASFNGNVLFSNDNIINTPDISNVTEYTTTITRQSLGTTNMRWLAMSSTGQHIAVINIATTPFTVFVSNDFGVTFSNRAGVGYTTASGSVAVSPTGRNMVAMAYAVGTSQAYIYSTNFGVNWATSPTLTTGSFTPTTTQPSLYVNDNGIIYFSNTTFAYSLPSLGSTTATTLSNNSNGQSISASYDGRYILSTHSSAAAYVSSNNGTSFSSTGQNGINGAVSGNGQYMLLLNGTNIVVSNNFGASGSWTTISAITVPNSAIYFTTSYNGQEIIVASNTNSSIYYSTNYGASWATLSTSLTNILNVVLSGDGSRYAISYAAGSNNVGISTATLINTTTRVKQKQITGFMDVSCGLIQPSFILGNPIAPTDDMYGSFIQLTGSANLFQVLPTPVISSRRSAEITIWNNSSVTQTILTPQGLIFGFAPAGSGLIDVLIQDRLKLRSDGYNWVNMASAYPPRLSYSVPPVLSPYDIGFMYLATQGSITSATLNSNQQLATITGVLTGFYMANVLHSITITATAITISAGFGSSTGTNNYREDSFTTTATVSTFPFALNSVISVSGTQTIYFNYRHNNSGASTSTNGNRTIFTLTRIG